MGTYKIDETDLFTSIKDLGWPKMLAIIGNQQCAILIVGHQLYENDDKNDPSYSALFDASNQTSLMDIPSSSELGKIFPSTFIHKYMVQNCKYKGGGLGKIEQEMYAFLDNLKI